MDRQGVLQKRKEKIDSTALANSERLKKQNMTGKFNEQGKESQL